MTEVKTYYYTDGNTVRQVEQPLPDRHTREREIREERERKRRQARRKAQAAMRRKRVYSMYIVSVAVALVGLFVGYINLTNSVTTHTDNISALEQNISDLKASNSATESRMRQCDQFRRHQDGCHQWDRAWSMQMLTRSCIMIWIAVII